MVIQVTIPLINPNEPEAVLADLPIQEGQQVKRGALLATLETTKATADLAAESAGYIAQLAFQAGETVRAGDLLCLITETPVESGSLVKPEPTPAAAEPALPGGIRITAPARRLAQTVGLDFTRLPADQLITSQ